MIKIGFVTCVQLGLSCMQAIYDSGGRISLAISLPDDVATRKSGRVRLDAFCNMHQIPLIKSGHVNDQVVVDAIKHADIDWLFIIGWSQIAHPNVLAAPKRGVLGAHPTLLPIGRGRASIPWAILKGLEQTGVTLFKMDNGVDTGPIAVQCVINLDKDESASTLYEKINAGHIKIIREFLPCLLVDRFDLIPQDDASATEWPGRRPEEGKINLCGSVWDAERLVRAVTRPYPGAFYIDGCDKTIVWKARVMGHPMENGRYITFYDGYLELVEFETEITANEKKNIVFF